MPNTNLKRNSLPIKFGEFVYFKFLQNIKTKIPIQDIINGVKGDTKLDIPQIVVIRRRYYPLLSWDNRDKQISIGEYDIYTLAEEINTLIGRTKEGGKIRPPGGHTEKW